MFLINPMMLSGNDLRSMDFESSSSQYLSISNANFGTYDTKKIAISVGLKLESLAATQYIYTHNDGVTPSFILYVTAVGSIHWEWYVGGVPLGLVTATGVITSGTYYHIYAEVDSTQGTADNRVKLYINGTQPTFLTRTDPALNDVNDSNTASIVIGVKAPGDLLGYFDGLMFQPAFFSGSVPGISAVYSGGAQITNLNSVSGLFSYLKTSGSIALEDDYKLSANWTNNNTVIKSVVIP